MSVAAPTRPLEDSMTVEDVELPTIDFVAPMPGFAEHQRFLLVRLDEEGMLYALTSIHDPALRFLVVPPVLFFPEYAPEVSQEAMDLLDVTDAGQVLVLLVIAAGETVADTTANLLAPILVNHANRRAIQVVLTGSDLPVRASLMATA
jgi:flagellar assembly factor FliW